MTETTPTDLPALIRRLRTYDGSPSGVLSLLDEAADALSRYQRLLTAAQAWRDSIQGRGLRTVAENSLLGAIEEFNHG